MSFLEDSTSNCAQTKQQQQIYPPCMPYQQQMPYQQPLPYFPTGLPLGQPTSPMPYSPETIGQPPMYSPVGAPTDMGSLQQPPLFSGEAPVETVFDINFTAGYLRTLIGRIVVVDFLIGTNTLVDRSGQLLQVGASYIVIKDIISGSQTMCDLYSIKFVRIYR